jgi:hypothetical protein
MALFAYRALPEALLPTADSLRAWVRGETHMDSVVTVAIAAAAPATHTTIDVFKVRGHVTEPRSKWIVMVGYDRHLLVWHQAYPSEYGGGFYPTPGFGPPGSTAPEFVRFWIHGEGLTRIRSEVTFNNVEPPALPLE